jgi:hypothetical protein
MKPKSVSKSVKVVAGRGDPVSSYASGLCAAEARICRKELWDHSAIRRPKPAH